MAYGGADLKLSQHLFHYTSSLDGARIPYLVGAPDVDFVADSDTKLSPSEKLPAVFILHDELSRPSPSEFIEEGYRLLAKWKSVLAELPPSLWIVPYGRGNGGWLGAGGRDFFDVWAETSQQFPIESKVSLLGIGAGATGALQLACWFPDRFHAVAAVGAWTDWSADSHVGKSKWMPWERSQRQAICPKSLARNLSSVALHLEHPWWNHGVGGSANPRHLESLIKELSTRRITFTAAEAIDSPGLVRESPVNPLGLCQWLLSAREEKTGEAIEFKTYGLRSRGHEWLRIARATGGGRPAILSTQIRGSRLRVKTRGVDAVSLAPAMIPFATDKRKKWFQLRLDHSKFRFKTEDDIHQLIHLERAGRNWIETAAHESNGKPTSPDTSLLGGPTMDLRWDRVGFVFGTLGDELDNSMMQSFAKLLKNRWETGADSLCPHPGDRTCTVNYPILADVDVTDAWLRDHHTVLVGAPHNNLILARLCGGLPCRWEDVPSKRSGASSRQFRIGDEVFDDPRDGVFFMSANPEFPDRYVAVFSANQLSSLASASQLETAFLPDYLVYRDAKVLEWGYFPHDTFSEPVQTRV